MQIIQLFHVTFNTAITLLFYGNTSVWGEAASHVFAEFYNQQRLVTKPQ